jgi:hypothetical protein
VLGCVARHSAGRVVSVALLVRLEGEEGDMARPVKKEALKACLDCGGPAVTTCRHCWEPLCGSCAAEDVEGGVEGVCLGCCIASTAEVVSDEL